MKMRKHQTNKKVKTKKETISTQFYKQKYKQLSC